MIARRSPRDRGVSSRTAVAPEAAARTASSASSEKVSQHDPHLGPRPAPDPAVSQIPLFGRLRWFHPVAGIRQAETQPAGAPKNQIGDFHQTFINSRIIFYLCPSLVAVIGSPFRFQLRKEKPPYATPLYNRGLMNLTRKIFEFHAVSKLWPGEGLLPGENRHPSSGSGANPRNARVCSQCLPDNPGQEHSISCRSAASVQPAPRSTPT